MSQALQVRDGSGAMFDGIAARYDLLNRVLSVGMDRGWRRKAARACALPPGGRYLDVAAGTGDLALAVAREHPGASVRGIDPSSEMLARSAPKAARARVTLPYDQGEAESLPYEAASFDAAGIAFGIRNCHDRPRALAEMRRVVRPGGRVVVLELSEPDGRVLGAAARFYLHQVVPWLGGLLSGQREYRYLQRSIAAFPPPAEFVAMMRQAGLVDVGARPLTFGACVLFTGTVP